MNLLVCVPEKVGMQVKLEKEEICKDWETVVRNLNLCDSSIADITLKSEEIDTVEK